MAVAPSPSSKSTVSALVKKKNKRKMLDRSDEGEEIKSPMSSDAVNSQASKRNKCPGVRVVGCRIYDSSNGTTCHQCRQKTLDISASCKNQARNKPCTLKFCSSCLLNRYGEKVEDVASLEEWNCPRCRDTCNCSICMKKRGHQPTGMLVQMAKAGGFSSVSDLLHVKGAGNVGTYKSPKKTIVSPRKQVAPEEGNIASSKKLGKENIFDGKTDSNANPPPSVPSPVEEKPKKMKRKGSKVMHDGSGVNDASVIEAGPALKEKGQKKLKQERLDKTQNSMVLLEKTSDHPDKKKLKKIKVENKAHNSMVLLEKASDHPDKKKQKKIKVEGSKEMIKGNVDNSENLKDASSMKSPVSKVFPKHDKANKKVNGVLPMEKAFETSIHDEVKVKQKNNLHEGGEVLVGRSDQNTNQHVVAKKRSKVKMNALGLHNSSFEAVVPLPTGSELVTIAGVDLPKGDVGNALQLLEFCATFGKILDVKKGQAEAVIRDLIKGRSARRGKYSVIVQFQIQLLSVIQDELGSESPRLELTHGNSSWLKALKSCIPKSQYFSEHMDCIDKEAGGYDNLDSSVKLRLLNFLCDEVLGTEKIRKWIDVQNIEFAEKRKEARDVFAAAREKEKSLKQKMQDDVAKALITRKGVPLTIAEHDAVVSTIKTKAAEAHAEMLECKRMVSTDKERPDAVRTKPIFRDNNGHLYWKLKGFSNKPDILCQDIGAGDSAVESNEKWFQFDAEQTDVIEKHISSLRSRIGKGSKSFNCSRICSA